MKNGVAVSAPVIVTPVPAICRHEYVIWSLSRSYDFVPSSVTLSLMRAVKSLPASATGTWFPAELTTTFVAAGRLHTLPSLTSSWK